MAEWKLFALALVVVALALAQDVFPVIQDGSGMITLDERGRALMTFPSGYLNTHFCSVGEGENEVTIGFTSNYFFITDGKPDQRITYACVPIPTWPPQFPMIRDTTGTVTLDKDGSVWRAFSAGYLDFHSCEVGNGPDKVTVGFSARYFSISDGQPDQRITWACPAR